MFLIRSRVIRFCHNLIAWSSLAASKVDYEFLLPNIKLSVPIRPWIFSMYPNLVPSFLCYPRCQFITWRGRKRKWREGLGDDFSKEAINRGTAIIRGNTVSPQSRGICTDVCMVEVGGGWGNGGPHHRKVKNFGTGPPCRAMSSLASDLSPLHLVSF